MVVTIKTPCICNLNCRESTLSMTLWQFVNGILMVPRTSRGPTKEFVSFAAYTPEIIYKPCYKIQSDHACCLNNNSLLLRNACVVVWRTRNVM